MRDLEHDSVYRDHSKREVAAKARKARGAAGDDMRTAGGTVAPELSEGFEKGSCAFPTNLWVVKGHLGHDESATDGENDDVNKFPVLALETLGHGGNIMRVALNNLEIRGSIGREDGRELRGITAESGALVAGSKGMHERREAHAGASAEECNGLGVATHCVGLVLVTQSKTGVSEAGSTFSR